MSGISHILAEKVANADTELESSSGKEIDRFHVLGPSPEMNGCEFPKKYLQLSTSKSTDR